MGLLRSLAGMVCLEVTSAAPADMLTAVNALGIPLFGVRHTGDLSVEISFYRQDYGALRQLLERRGEKWKEVKKSGLYWTFRRTLHRSLLLSGVALLLFLVLFLPTRVYFIRVEGNQTVPTRLILAKAEQCGIVFGASRREVRSERMKNALLEEIPELQWAGINTSGCVATISVRERSVTEEKDPDQSVGSIVAIRDGVIRECTVLKGNPLCTVGQAVKAGQVLISGYTDTGLSIQATRAEGEIYAETLRQMQVVTLSDAAQRGEITKTEKKYSLLIGKKLIKLFKDSGISDTSCVKMYERRYLTLPGDFQLPVAVICETLHYYDTETVQATDSETFDWMLGFSEDYLGSQMIAGQIMASDVQLDLQEGHCGLTGKYACLEMIGRVQNEEIIGGNGTNN